MAHLSHKSMRNLCPNTSPLRTLTQAHLNGDRLAIHRLDEKMRSLFEMLTKGKPHLDEKIKTTHGEAISPRVAASCINDTARTGALLMGAHQAIRASNAQTSLRFAEISCGPLAPSALCTALIHPNVSFDLVDIHPVNMEILEAAIQHLGLERDRFRLHCGNAMEGNWKHLNPDIALVEVMNNGLLDEPQGAVIAHLTKQFSDSTRWIPKTIEVSLQLYHGYQEPQSERANLGVVARIDDAFREKAKTSSIEEMIQVRASFPIPETKRDKSQNGALLTEIQVFGRTKIFASMLTQPRLLLGRTKVGDSQVHVEFEMGADNGIMYSTP